MSQKILEYGTRIKARDYEHMTRFSILLIVNARDWMLDAKTAEKRRHERLLADYANLCFAYRELSRDSWSHG